MKKRLFKLVLIICLFGFNAELSAQQQIEVGYSKSFHVIHDLRGGIYYSNDSASYKSYEAVAQYIKSYPNWVFEISVNTDHRGSEEANLKLSQFIAENACNVFRESFDIQADRVIPKGSGESNPIISEKAINEMDTKEEKEIAHKKNRRYEVKAIKKYAH